MENNILFKKLNNYKNIKLKIIKLIINKKINTKRIIITISIIIFLIGVIVLSIVKNKDDDNYTIEQFDNSVQNRDLKETNEKNKVIEEKETKEIKEENERKDNDNSVTKENEKIYIHIIGEIKNSGVIQLEKGNRIVDAIEKAGGATEKADLSKINLAFVLSDGQKVRIPSVNDKDLEEYITQDSGNNIIMNEQNYNLKTGGGKVNINTATQTELETLTGIGPSLAARILDYRNKNGKFKKIDELRNVKGIGQSKYDGIKDEVVVD